MCGCGDSKVYMINTELGEIENIFEGHTSVSKYDRQIFFFFFKIYFVECNLSGGAA